MRTLMQHELTAVSGGKKSSYSSCSCSCRPSNGKTKHPNNGFGNGPNDGVPGHSNHSDWDR
jgi:hypothetical protein